MKQPKFSKINYVKHTRRNYSQDIQMYYGRYCSVPVESCHKNCFVLAEFLSRFFPRISPNYIFTYITRKSWKSSKILTCVFSSCYVHFVCSNFIVLFVHKLSRTRRALEVRQSSPVHSGQWSLQHKCVLKTLQNCNPNWRPQSYPEAQEIRGPVSIAIFFLSWVLKTTGAFRRL